ncbi:DUF488 domain-containing protein [Niveispirillum cyanobacteriorum]|uniref:Uncharacterized protein n=1 Tax=Niveispirillum cyanobacteriorum TaxID=1612173 RepID=A0A2K9NE83_9PROT|nr:DUF488 domain-containing protein [Niveispirillum cyanobacteriorum]AUN30836.1 hypothetical protein C0V82_11745 [Niveispirillum cyanobacteriorum]GGE80047.1 hypothetical protein GCM10011317_41520 [Niveispirillum cyanobacteriorum]
MILHTIGYEGASQGAVIAALKAAGVRLLLDVRELPSSRRAGFSKSPLRASLEAEGIAYLHLKKLGTPKEGRLANRAGRMDEFWSIVEEGLARPEAQYELGLAGSLSLDKPACLLCFEADHSQCHRLTVANRLTAAHGFDVIHLRPDPGF